MTAASLLIALLTSGCFATIEGGPPQLFTLSEEAAATRVRVIASEEGYYSTVAQNKATRNEIIASRMRAVDAYYYAYERSLIRERQEAGFISSIISIGLSLAVPLVNAESTKNILGAASAGVQGATKAYSDEVLFQKTVQVLATQMRARRDAVAAEIITRMKQLSIEEYPLAMALGDIDEYYAAGTIAGALIEIQKTVSTESREAEAKKVEATIRVSFGPDSVSEALIAFVYPNGIRAGRDRTRSAQLTGLLVAQGVRTPLSIVLFDKSPNAAILRRTIAKQAGIIP